MREHAENIVIMVDLVKFLSEYQLEECFTAKKLFNAYFLFYV